MNRDEALELLKAGEVEEWNRRRKSGETISDLSRAHLSGANLSGANLSEADLSHADLSRAHLSGADLSRANLSGANLSGANLSGANLSEANLSRAHLKHADLSRANLRHADLSRANLSHANLVEADLSRAHLSHADLSRANLSHANLVEADLSHANLVDADLSEAVLSEAVLSGADLSHADLSRADLVNANLSFSNLSDANLVSALCGSTVFAFADFSNVKGLETVDHIGPSEIGVHTLYESRGKIPDVFLRGCGVPADLITYLPSLIGPGIEFYSCFISYSHKNQEVAQRLHSRMQQEKLRVWYAPEDLRGGRKTIRQIDEAIRVHDKLLLVLSKQSMQSEWVKTEIRRARQAELRDGRQKLFPIRLCSMKAIQEWECFDSNTGEDLADAVREYHIPDFSQWKDHDAFEAVFARLLKDLRASEK
jgi:uncharacterized protein YjbI with pentapeptide repeats